MLLQIILVQNHNLSAWYSDIQRYPNHGSLGTCTSPHDCSVMMLSVIKISAINNTYKWGTICYNISFLVIRGRYDTKQPSFLVVSFGYN